MGTLRYVPAGSDLANVFAYSRAVRIGNVTEVCGTGSYDSDGNLVGPGDFYTQTRTIYAIIKKALADAGATFEDVAKITIFATDMSRWPEVARAHTELFCEINPAVTMVGITALIEPEMLVKIEPTAILEG
jgi:enamine deaminase RidA (YjgF/YER057c/UK114 family)